MIPYNYRNLSIIFVEEKEEHVRTLNIGIDETQIFSSGPLTFYLSDCLQPEKYKAYNQRQHIGCKQGFNNFNDEIPVNIERCRGNGVGN